MAGTQEPIYGPSAIQSVAKQAETTPNGYTELTKDDLKWVAMDSTSVETQSFYLMADSGHIALAQVIYSNVASVSLSTLCSYVMDADVKTVAFARPASLTQRSFTPRAKTNLISGRRTHSRMSTSAMTS